MSRFRDELVRAVFELERDLAWWKGIEPRLTSRGVDGAQLESCRGQWNLHAEHKYWPWWQAEAKRFSMSELDNMRMDGVDQLGALGLWQWKQDNAASDQERFRQILTGTVTREEQPQEQSRERGRER